MELNRLRQARDQRQREGKDDDNQHSHENEFEYAGDQRSASVQLVSLIYRACSTLLTRKDLGQRERVTGVSECFSIFRSQTRRRLTSINARDEEEREIANDRKAAPCYKAWSQKMRMY